MVVAQGPPRLHIIEGLQSSVQDQVPVLASHMQLEGTHTVSIDGTQRCPLGQPVSRQVMEGSGSAQASLLSATHAIGWPQSAVQSQAPVSSSHEQAEGTHTSPSKGRQDWPVGQPVSRQVIAGLGPSQRVGAGACLQPVTCMQSSVQSQAPLSSHVQHGGGASQGCGSQTIPSPHGIGAPSMSQVVG
jgi:hypothetical protein